MEGKNLITSIIFAALIAVGAVTVDRYFLRSCSSGSVTPKACALKTAMRKLWADHVIWTREYIVSAVADAQDNKDVTERLMKNQADIGDAIGQFYGADAGNALTVLLKDHISLAGEVVTAAKAGNQEKLRDADARWHKNAEDMSHFLNKANNDWTVNELLTMFNDHLRLTTDEATARIKKEWKKDIKAFDEIFDQIMKMADMFTTGIIKQFPGKF
jgi:hypothetical protein